MQNLLNDRRVLFPTLLASVVIAIGSVLTVLLSSDASGGSSGGPVATTSPPTTSLGAMTVDITDFKFAPIALTVKTGSKVTWTNHDVAPHTATARGAFDTGTLKKNDQKTLTFAKPGVYAYVCEFHPFMKGTLTVQ